MISITSLVLFISFSVEDVTLRLLKLDMREKLELEDEREEDEEEKEEDEDEEEGQEEEDRVEEEEVEEEEVEDEEEDDKVLTKSSKSSLSLS